MSKTYKDKANYARFNARENILNERERRVLEMMETDYNIGLRHGHTRKSIAKDKHIERKVRRAKEKAYLYEYLDD